MSKELTHAIQQNGSSLYRVAWRILRHAEEVDDVLQDVILEAMEFSRRETVKSWPGLLKRLTVCRSLDRLRKRRPIESFDEGDLRTSRVNQRNGSPVDNAIGRELASRLRNVISKLPARQAEVFSLRYFDDCDNQEIASTLRISSAAVATALRKSRLKISELLSINLEQGKCHESK